MIYKKINVVGIIFNFILNRIFIIYFLVIHSTHLMWNKIYKTFKNSVYIFIKSIN